MLNVRKLKQDFSQPVLKEGKQLFEGDKILTAHIAQFDTASLKVCAKIAGQFNNSYECHIEVDREACEFIDSDCDCPYNYDCQHLAALIFYLEAHLGEMLLRYTKENNLEEMAEEQGLNASEKQELLNVVKEAVSREEFRQNIQYQKEVLQEYHLASDVLSKSPFFVPIQNKKLDHAELMVVVNFPPASAAGRVIAEVQFALRLPSRSKPLHIPAAKEFIEALRYEETLHLGGKKYLFSLESFPKSHRALVRMLLDHARLQDRPANERAQKSAFLEMRALGMMLAHAHEIALERLGGSSSTVEREEKNCLPCFFKENLEQPICFSQMPALFKINLEYLAPPSSKILLSPSLLLEEQQIPLEEVKFFECSCPGLLHKEVFYRFAPQIVRQHLVHLSQLREVTIPEHLFGTLIENGLPHLASCALIGNRDISSRFVTFPYVGELGGVCDLSYLDGELEATLFFLYDSVKVPALSTHLKYDEIAYFMKPEGILSRNLVQEREIIDDLFQDFTLDQENGTFIARSDKKIVEFMTETIPRNQGKVTFNCPQNLLDQFIYDKSSFELHFSHTDRVDQYIIDLKVNGHLLGVTLDALWECILTRRAFIELDSPQKNKKSKVIDAGSRYPKILVLDLDKLGRLVQLFDELGIHELKNHTITRPLWSLASLDEEHFADLAVLFTITDRLTAIRAQMLGQTRFESSPIPASITLEPRPYQLEGVQWLERLRSMYLSGVLADDMGLGKSFQAITAIAQAKEKDPGKKSLIICPTSLLYNWKEEFSKFCPHLNVLVIDGVPAARKKMIDQHPAFDVLITSYSLLQKDIEYYQEIQFGYAILDEAQHIKNRGTRNAKSVKQLIAEHRLILSGTPIENSLEELWSLFDYLMPGFLSTFDRFVEKYVRGTPQELVKNLAYLKRKISPFILRRMKSDVLKDLPPISELVYHSPLSSVQQELYHSYAASARDELVRLVERDGFDKVQIHVLATLTRLKQICCHPAIFAKDRPESGDSAKYDLLLELLDTLIEGGHKTVIFSQYTKMLQIMRADFEKKGIRFVYLDGSSKDRLGIVKRFNEDSAISVFLVSLKAGGTGLNLVGADTVIHYDMWWNPAVQSQATDRVYRLGQTQAVSVYQLVTLGTIEEKIVQLQERKKGLVKQVVSCEDEIIGKLSWEEVLELLNT